MGVEFGTTKQEQQKPTALTEQPKLKREKKEVPKKEEETSLKFEIPTTTLQQVIGMKRQKILLHKYLELPLRKAKDFEGFNLPKSTGIIFYGPPGTGKTYVAKAICGELKIPMCYVMVSSIMTKYVGEPAQNIHRLFLNAVEHQPSTIFFDEADSLMQDRDKIDADGGGLQLKQAVSQMLTETSLVFDNKQSHVYMLAATNAPWDIDKAHKRPGRFSNILYVGAPSLRERKGLFKYYLTNVTDEYKPKIKRIDYWLLALGTMYYSPADIQKACNVAMLNAIEKDKVRITTRTIQKVLWSPTGKSSLDHWYISMIIKKLPQRKSILKSILFAGYRKRDPPSEQGRFDKADMIIYAEMIHDIKRYAKIKWIMRIVRVYGKGIPRFM